MLKKLNFFEFFPSLVWTFFVVLPFIFQHQYFNDLGKNIEFFSIFYVAFVIFLADSFCAKNNLSKDFSLNFKRNIFFDLLPCVFLCSLIIHLCLMPSIPLLGFFFHSYNFGSAELSQLRESSLKLLEVPQIFKYFLNWSIIIFCPICVSYFFSTSRRWVAFFYAIFLIFYCISTTAKFPAVEFLGSLFFIFIFTHKKFYFVTLNFIKFIFPVFVLGILFLLHSNGVDQKFKLNEKNYSLSIHSFDAKDPRRSFSLADNYRSNYFYSENKFDLNYLFYRVLLTPVDVSNRWFQYFSLPENKSIGFSNFWPFSRSEDTITSAQSVGLWAFKERFPERYLDTVSANASFDADAFSRFGLLGVIIGPLVLISFRIFSSLMITKNPFSILSYCILIAMLTLLPFISSLQAIIGSHGLIILILVMMYFKLRHDHWGMT